MTHPPSVLPVPDEPGLPPVAPQTDTPAPAVVQAAGVLCWRLQGEELEVLLVHRPRYDDWSFPKGKLHPGELLPECAVRELAEETGARAVLGRPLPGTRYTLPSGETKTVAYWAAHATRAGRRTAPATEIDDVRWMSSGAARGLVTRDDDRRVLEALVEHHRSGTLDTAAVVVLRHAVTRPRDNWPRADAERPLVAAGRRQASALAGLLACWQPEHVLSSPWRRCLETLAPWAATNGVKVRTKGGLTESGFRRDPGKAHKHAARLLDRQRGGLLCTHRPVLASVLAAVRDVADAEVRPGVPDADPYLAPGEALVAHVVHPPAAAPRVVAVERHTAPR